MDLNQRVTLLAVVCVAATLATFSTAVQWRLRVWRDGRNGVRASQGNYNVAVEAVRLLKQSLLVVAAVKAISEPVLFIVCAVSSLMALTSVLSIIHNRRIIRHFDEDCR